MENNYHQIKIAVIIAIIFGLGTSVLFLVIEKESYSAIYILPDSIIHIPDDNTVLYIYGITSSETQRTNYTIVTYVGDTQINSKQISLNNGETLEERVKTILPVGVQYPEKITLTLKTGEKSDSVHFWITNEPL